VNSSIGRLSPILFSNGFRRFFVGTGCVSLKMPARCPIFAISESNRNPQDEARRTGNSSPGRAAHDHSARPPQLPPGSHAAEHEQLPRLRAGRDAVQQVGGDQRRRQESLAWGVLSIGVGTKDKLRPSLRTGQANFLHPALQLVVGLQRRSADASRARFRFEQWMAPVTRAAIRLRSTVEGLHTCVALHRFESRGHSRCVFPSFLLFVVSTFLPPLAPRALPRFSATTEALSPSGHGSSGLRQTMKAAPSPDRDP